MQTQRTYPAHIEVITEKQPAKRYYYWRSSDGVCNIQRIPLLGDSSGAKPFLKESDILNICREHYSDYLGNLGEHFGKILSYRYHFDDGKFIDYMVSDLQSA